MNTNPTHIQDSQILLQEMIEATKAQTKAELESAALSKEILEEKKRIRQAEDDRTKLLKEINSRLNLLSNLMHNNLYPEITNLINITQLSIELLRIVASSVAGSISDKKLNENLQNLLVKITDNKHNVIVNANSKNLNSGSDISLTAQNDVNLE